MRFPLKFGAGNESRTRDLNLGKVALYQLSYSRKEHRSGCKFYIIFQFFVWNCSLKTSNISSEEHYFNIEFLLMSNPTLFQPALSQISNTLALPCVASHAVTLTSLDQLPTVSSFKEDFGKVNLIGGGSNLILPEKLDGLTVLVRNKGINYLGEKQGCHIVEVAAGEVWHDWIAYALRHGWYGLENLALIPGTVGAAPVQNIGAYGVELAQLFDSVKVWDFRKNALQILTKQECSFSYRHSIFKQDEGIDLLIVSVTFRLPVKWTAVLDYPDLHDLRESIVTPQAVFEKVVSVRRRKLPDPEVTPNVGSFFKNPVVNQERYQKLKRDFPALIAYPQTDGKFKLAAGWLIDFLGWKGRQVGPVKIHDRQALVLTNAGGASAADVLMVAGEIQRDVAQQFGVELHIEPACWAK